MKIYYVNGQPFPTKKQAKKMAGKDFPVIVKKVKHIDATVGTVLSFNGLPYELKQIDEDSDMLHLVLWPQWGKRSVPIPHEATVN